MKTFARLFVLFASCAAMADIGWYQGNTRFGRVVDVSCRADGGLLCTRDGGVGVLTCNAASSTEPGCITPSAQTLAGAKSWTGRQRIIGAGHGSLTACSSGEKGTWQTCTTHNAPVFCDGTTNHELLGSQTDEAVLTSVHVNGIPPYVVFGSAQLPSSADWTINALAGHWVAGSGAGNLRLGISGSAGNCYCDIDCDNPSARTACSGACTYTAADSIIFFRGTSGTVACALDPHVSGGLQVMGVAQ